MTDNDAKKPDMKKTDLQNDILKNFKNKNEETMKKYQEQYQITIDEIGDVSSVFDEILNAEKNHKPSQRERIKQQLKGKPIIQENYFIENPSMKKKSDEIIKKDTAKMKKIKALEHRLEILEGTIQKWFEDAKKTCHGLDFPKKDCKELHQVIDIHENVIGGDDDEKAIKKRSKKIERLLDLINLGIGDDEKFRQVLSNNMPNVIFEKKPITDKKEYEKRLKKMNLVQKYWELKAQYAEMSEDEKEARKKAQQLMQEEFNKSSLSLEEEIALSKKILAEREEAFSKKIAKLDKIEKEMVIKEDYSHGKHYAYFKPKPKDNSQYHYERQSKILGNKDGMIIIQYGWRRVKNAPEQPKQQFLTPLEDDIKNDKVVGEPIKKDDNTINQILEQTMGPPPLPKGPIFAHPPRVNTKRMETDDIRKKPGFDKPEPPKSLPQKKEEAMIIKKPPSSLPPKPEPPKEASSSDSEFVEYYYEYEEEEEEEEEELLEEFLTEEQKKQKQEKLLKVLAEERIDNYGKYIPFGDEPMSPDYVNPALLNSSDIEIELENEGISKFDMMTPEQQEIAEEKRLKRFDQKLPSNLRKKKGKPMSIDAFRAKLQKQKEELEANTELRLKELEELKAKEEAEKNKK
jgi:hypothetical protein